MDFSEVGKLPYGILLLKGLMRFFFGFRGVKIP